MIYVFRLNFRRTNNDLEMILAMVFHFKLSSWIISHEMHWEYNTIVVCTIAILVACQWSNMSHLHSVRPWWHTKRFQFLRFPIANAGTAITLYIVRMYSVYHFYYTRQPCIWVFMIPTRPRLFYICFATPRRFMNVECLKPCRCCLSAYMPHNIVDHYLEEIGYYLTTILHVACFMVIVCSYMPNIAVDCMCILVTTYFSIDVGISKSRSVTQWL
jgi:hypothetical protein